MGRRSGPEGEHYVTSHASSLPMGDVAQHAPHVPPCSPPSRSLCSLPTDGGRGSRNRSIYPPVYPLLAAITSRCPAQTDVQTVDGAEVRRGRGQVRRKRG